MEYIDIYDPEGNLLGKKSKLDAVKDNNWHKAVHLWVINSKGELLLQKRSPDKDINPDMWDFPAGGHVDSGEESIVACLREAKEELGIDVNESDIKYLFTVKSTPGHPTKPIKHYHIN